MCEFDDFSYEIEKEETLKKVTSFLKYNMVCPSKDDSRKLVGYKSSNKMNNLSYVIKKCTGTNCKSKKEITKFIRETVIKVMKFDLSFQQDKMTS